MHRGLWLILLVACDDGTPSGAAPTPDGAVDATPVADSDPPAPLCTDGRRGDGETDTDCGGACMPCAEGALCVVASDCASGVCTGQCAAPTCGDAVANGPETDTDCGGGECPPCADDGMCRRSWDCAGGRCEAERCVPAACGDGVDQSSEGCEPPGTAACDEMCHPIACPLVRPVARFTFDGIAGLQFLEAADVTGDGRIDLVVGDALGGVAVGVRTRTDYERGPELEVAVQAIALGDLDGDGVTEVVVSEPWKLHVFDVSAEGRLISRLEVRTAAFTWSSLVVADFDRDGRPDVGLAGQLGEGRATVGRLEILRNTTPSRGAMALESAAVFDLPPVHAVTAGDVNGDGLIDLVLALIAEERAVIQVLAGDGVGFVPQPLQAELTFGPEVAAADLDLDGDLDLIAGAVFLYNRGDGTFASSSFLRPFVSSMWCDDVALGDLDGDGILDVVLASREHGLLWYRNRGNTFYDGQPPLDVFSNNIPRVVLVDGNLDGRLDVMASSGFGNVTVLAMSCATCGDGLVQGPEETCDDGNRAADDGCSSDCRTEP